MIPASWRLYRDYSNLNQASPHPPNWSWSGQRWKRDWSWWKGLLGWSVFGLRAAFKPVMRVFCRWWYSFFQNVTQVIHGEEQNHFLEYLQYVNHVRLGQKPVSIEYHIQYILPFQSKSGYFRNISEQKKNCWIGTIKTKGSVRTCFLPSQSQYSLLHWLWNYNNLLQANQ